MSTAAPALMTTEEFLALPDDGMERWLIRGELRERPMTVRNRFHSGIVGRITGALEIWRRQQPKPRGEVLAGEAGCRLTRDPVSIVGIDVAYLSPELAEQQSDETTLIEGVPTLAVEVLSPNDTQADIHDKITTYLEAGVPLVWIVDPDDHTIKVYSPDAQPVLFNVLQKISADPHLPGFEMPVQEIFER